MNDSTDMQQLVTIDAAPARLSVNFDEVKAALEERLADYDVVVSEDGVKEAKALATEINKLAQEIDRRRKDEVANVSEPIRQFDEQMKELRDLCKERRQTLLNQVQQFEDETREKVRNLLKQHVNSLWLRDGVEQEFRRATTDDLVKLSSITAGGNLAKAAKDAVEDRVRADRQLQETVKTRLLELEARSYRHGLSAPLTRDHVYRFLEADDETYEAELERLLAVEMEREEAAQKRRQQQAEREAARAAEQKAEQPAVQPEAPAAHEPAEPEIEAPEGKVAVRVSCDFDITVAPHVSDEDIKAELRKVLNRAGITTLADVRVRRGETTEAVA